MLSRTYSELLCSKNKGFVARASRFAADLESIHAAFLTPIPESDQRDHHQEDLRSADRGGDAEGLAQYVQQSSKEDAHLLAKDWLHRKSPAGAAHVRPAPGRLASTDMPPFMAFCSPPSSSPTPPFAAPLPSTDISVVDEDDKHREADCRWCCKETARRHHQRRVCCGRRWTGRRQAQRRAAAHREAGRGRGSRFWPGWSRWTQWTGCWPAGRGWTVQTMVSAATATAAEAHAWAYGPGACLCRWQ